MDVEELLSDHEGKTLEFKRDASSSGPIVRTLSAFSNTAGGTLVIGVHDRTRAVAGIDDPLGVEQRIMNLAADAIRPQILPEVEIVPYRRTALVVVTVFPGARRPYYVQGLGREAGTFVRVGASNRRASPEILAELARTARNVGFDEEPMIGLTGGALDLDLARRRFAGRRDLDERDLLTLNLLARDGRSCVPTTGAIILFGRERLRHFPDARIRLARFAGTSRANLADRLEVESDPIQAIEDAIAFLGRSIPVGMALAGARRRDLPQFAPTALREAVVNAVVHADYSQSGSPIRIAVFDDRVEIENPGLLPFGLTIEEIQRGVSKLRNRIIGRVFHELGLIEQWGSGIRRMTEACEALGAPPPTFEEIATCFRVTLHAAAGKQRLALSGTAERIHQLMADGKSRSTAAIAGKLGMSPRTVRTHILRLVEQGLIVEIGKGPTDPRRVYRRAGLR